MSRNIPTRHCSRCNKPGPLARNRSCPDGFGSWCLKCTREVAAARRKTVEGRAYQRNYKRGIRGRILAAWCSLNDRAGNRDGKHPTYADVRVLITRDEFLKWAEIEFSRWMSENPGGRPSVDRIGPSIHYEPGNLRVISCGQNSREQPTNKNIRAPEGMAWCSGRCKTYKPITEFSKYRRATNGLDPECKSCKSIQFAKWYQSKKECRNV